MGNKSDQPVVERRAFLNKAMFAATTGAVGAAAISQSANAANNGSYATVDTIAQLKANVVDDFVNVLGYHHRGDGGGGQYYYDSTAKIAANDSTVVSNHRSGKWILAQTDALSVKQFGAKGDGVTDDTDAIQSALNAAGAGSTILFNRGEEYYISGRLHLASSHNDIVIDGNQCAIINDGYEGGLACFKLNGCNNVTFKNFRFDLNNSDGAGGQAGFIIENSETIRIENCDFSECHQGVKFTGTKCRDILVDGCIMHSKYGAGEGYASRNIGSALVLGGDVSDDVVVTRCKVSKTAKLLLSGVSTHWVVTHCVAEDTGDSSIYLRGDHHIISSNVVLNAGKDGIKILGAQDGSGDFGEYNVVSNNIVNGSGLHLSTGGSNINVESNNTSISGNTSIVVDLTELGGAATYNTGCRILGSDISVTGNSISGSVLQRTRGIYIKTSTEGSHNISVSGNTVSGVETGISILGSDGLQKVSNVTISGNTVSDTHSHIECQQSGSSGAENVVIANNTFNGCESTAIRLKGVGGSIHVSNNAFTNSNTTRTEDTCIYVHAKNSARANVHGNSSDGSELQPILNNGSTQGVCAENNSWNYRDFAPASRVEGYWWAGNKVWFNAPKGGKAVGAVCISSGTPGIWKNFGDVY